MQLLSRGARTIAFLLLLGKNRREMFYSFYCFTKIWEHPARSQRSELFGETLCFLPSPPAVAAPVITCAAFTKKTLEIPRHTTQVLTNKADTTNSRSHGRRHFTSIGVWPGELLPWSGWFNILRESRWYSDLKSPLSKRKLVYSGSKKIPNS